MSRKIAGRIYRLESSFWVPADIDAVWAFASKPKNLAKISPANLNVKVDFEGEAYEGLDVKIHIRPNFSPAGISWVSRIENVIKQGDERQFQDIQISGPFAYWKHTHKFIKGLRDVESGAGSTVRSMHPGTWIVDSVEYKMPLGPLGTIAHAVVVNRLLKNMFRDRKSATLAVLG